VLVLEMLQAEMGTLMNLSWGIECGHGEVCRVDEMQVVKSRSVYLLE
jgi:hypothetical protein